MCNESDHVASDHLFSLLGFLRISVINYAYVLKSAVALVVILIWKHFF